MEAIRNTSLPREGVEKLNESLRDLPVTQNQQEFIQKLLMDFPDSKDLLGV